MLIFVFSALIVLTDQFFKHWIVLTHDVGEETVLIPGVLSLFRLHNPGAAFGFLAGQPWWFLAGIQLLAAIVLVMIILRYTEGFWGSLGLAAVLGGTVGNLIDRVFTFGTEFPHHVTDMFRFTFIDFAIFNIADVFITLGFLTFLIHFIGLTFKPKEQKRAFIDGEDDDDDEDIAIATKPVANAAVAPVTTDAAPVAADTAPVPAVASDSSPAPAIDADAAPVGDDIAPMLVFDALATPAAPVVDEAAAVPEPSVDADATPVAEAAPISPPIPQVVGKPSEDMTEPVEPMAIFGDGLQAEDPLLKPAVPEGELADAPAPPPASVLSSQTEPLPIVDAIVSQPGPEIAPLLDYVYGGQYAAAAQTTAPASPQPQEAPPVAASPQTPPTAAQPSAKSLTPEPVVEPVAQTTQSAPQTEVPSTPPIDEDNPKAMLDALSALETEILGDAENYDVDKLLGEYGFESDADDAENNN